MNYCSNCGEKLHQDNIFCSNCGAEVRPTRSGDLIHFTCNSCNTKYSAKPEQEGKKGTCKTCGELIVVPNSQRTPRFDIPKFDEAPALVFQTETSWETTCPTCIFFQEETDVCKKFSFKVRAYPKKFADKCNGKFYKRDPNKAIEETGYAIGADHIAATKNPPKSSFEIGASTSVAPYFFTTSTLKLTLMSICTLGFYELYWFYKNWALIEERTGQNIMPFWRAFFAPFWAYSCFKHIKTSAGENNIQESLSIGFLAVVYFILHVSWKLPDPLWLITFFTFATIIPANSVALNVNNKLINDFKNNDEFSGWNWVGLVLGGLMLLLGLIGTFWPAV